MRKHTPLLVLFTSLIIITIVLSACSGSSKVDSITVAEAFPHATRETISSAFRTYNFNFNEEDTYSGQPIVTAASPDGIASLQMLGAAEDIQAARTFIYLPIDASSEFADQQYVYFQLLLTSIFKDTWPAMEEWLLTATYSIAERSNASLQGGATVTTPFFSEAGDLAVSLYVRLDQDGNGFLMGLVVGDWLKDIGYDPTRNVWEPQ